MTNAYNVSPSFGQQLGGETPSIISKIKYAKAV
jgi:hypothetical protein